MSTTAITTSGRQERRVARTRSAGIHIGRIGLGSVGVLTVLVAAWGGIAPYIGPSFGYSADGASSWHWSLSHSVLALAPGALAVVVGLLILGESRGIATGRGRLGLTTAGAIVVLCGAWFVLGPLAWPVITNHGAYFTGATPLRTLANQAGYALGTGLLLAIFGGFVIGWAARHQPKATTPVVEATPPLSAEVVPEV